MALRRKSRAILLLTLAFLAILAIPGARPARAAGDDGESVETLLEQAAARQAELESPLAPSPAWSDFGRGTGGDGPLFVGVDDVTISTYRIDVTNGTATPQFTGFQVWGAAYDPDNDRVLFNNGSTLYEWPVGGAVNPLGTMTVPGGATINFVGLAFHDGTLYGVRNIANEAVYTIDTTTLVATVLIDYVDGDFDLGGFAVDPATGEFYATNDDTTPNGSGLFRINNDGSGTLITPYPGGETDIDGLAIGGGFAYLVTDQPGSIYVWDLTGGAFAAPLPNPWTTSEVFSGGAWIDAGTTAQISLAKTVGTAPGVCAPTDSITVVTGTPVYYCYEVENTGSVTFEFHDLVDDHLGQLLDDEPITLAPGATYQHIEPDVATATVTNTGTWTASDALAGYEFDDTVANGFLDISGTGTALNLTDDSFAGITIAFPFELYGAASPDLCVSNNGHVVHGTLTCASPFTNGPLPSGALGGAAIAPYWDDLDDESGNVYHQGFGAAPNRTHIIQWHQRPHFPGPNANTVTLQLVLHETTNEIELFYQDTTFGDPNLDNGASATVGIQLSAAFGNQYSFDTPGSIPDTAAILAALATVVEASASDSATVNIADPDVAVDPTSLSSTLPPGGTEDQDLDVLNNGIATLDWSFAEAPPPLRDSPSGTLVFYSDRATFDAENPGLPLEDFEGSLVPPNSVLACDGPFNSATNNACYAPGTILDGISLNNTTPGNQMVVLTVGFLGAPSTLVGPNTFVDELDVSFPNNDVESAGFDLQLNAPGDVTLTVFGVGGVPLGNQTIPVGQIGTPTFWGVAAGEIIESIHVVAPAGLGELVDDAAFGTPSGCASPEDLPWVSVAPDTGSTPPMSSSPVVVTFAAGVLPPGLYEGLLCLLSNDPDTPRLEVPVSLVVDSMPFLDGFETGDTSRWTLTVP